MTGNEAAGAIGRFQVVSPLLVPRFFPEGRVRYCGARGEHGFLSGSVLFGYVRGHYHGASDLELRIEIINEEGLKLVFRLLTSVRERWYFCERDNSDEPQISSELEIGG